MKITIIDEKVPKAKINPNKVVIKPHSISFTAPEPFKVKGYEPYDQSKIPSVLCRMATIVKILEGHSCLKPIDIKGVSYDIVPVLHTRHLYFPEHPFARTFGDNEIATAYFGIKTVMGNGGPEFAIAFELKKSEMQEETGDDSRMNARALDKEEEK